MRVFILYNFLISNPKKNSARYDHNCTYDVMQSVHYSSQILMKPELCPQIFKKSSNIKFHENPFSGSRFVSCGLTDGRAGRHDEVNIRFSQFCESG